jgi:NADH-quinone oxidoreductase subunit E
LNKNISEAMELYGDTREHLISVMQYLVTKENWLSADVMKELAEAFGLSHAEVYGTASFYSFLNIEPCGRYIIRLCKTISCDMSGKETIMDTLKNLLKIEIGETTPDGIFTLQETNCLGWCHKGPAMLINDEVFTELTPEKTEEIIKEYIDNERQYCSF